MIFLLSLLPQTKCAIYWEGGEALAQVAQGSCGFCIPGSARGGVGWDFEQPGLVKVISAHDGGLVGL